MAIAKPCNRRWTIIAVFIFVFLLRFIYITNSTAEAGNFWRQADTESIARNFVTQDFNILHPQFNYDGPYPNYVQLELQITTFLIAVLYKLFGFHYWIARLVPIAFFMGSACFVYLIARRFYTQAQALIAVLIYGILPLNLFYSRAIMPESALLCFFTGGFYFFIKWIDDERLYDLLLSGVMTCLAITQKLPAVFVGLAMLLICIEKYRLKIFIKWQLWVFAALALVPSLLFYRWSGRIAEFNFVDKIGAYHILPKFSSAINTPQAIKFYKLYLVDYLGLISLGLSVIGLFTTLRKKDRSLLYWSLAMILEVLMIVSVIRFKYYLILLTPIIAILSGKLLGWLWSKHLVFKPVLIALVVFIGYSSFQSVEKDFHTLRYIDHAAAILNTYTKPGDLIVIGDNHPTVLSVSNRAGWRANIKYYIYIPKQKELELDYYIQHGAKYFLVRNDYIVGDRGKAYVKYLKKNYKGTVIDEEFVLYKLQ